MKRVPERASASRCGVSTYRVAGHSQAIAAPLVGADQEEVGSLACHRLPSKAAHPERLAPGVRVRHAGPVDHLADAVAPGVTAFGSREYSATVFTSVSGTGNASRALASHSRSRAVSRSPFASYRRMHSSRMQA